MSKEGISVVRKAIAKSAEELAEKEFLDKPEQRHYDKALNLYKNLRDLNLEFFKDVIFLTAKRKELKDEMGIELYKIFDVVWTQILSGTAGYESKMVEALKQIRETKKLSPGEYEKEILNLTERFLQEKGNQIKNDPRVVSAFSEKEEILNKAIEFEKAYFYNLTKSYYKHQKLKVYFLQDNKR